jgi:hypothetical protein
MRRSGVWVGWCVVALVGVACSSANQPSAASDAGANPLIASGGSSQASGGGGNSTGGASGMGGATSSTGGTTTGGTTSMGGTTGSGGTTDVGGPDAAAPLAGWKLTWSDEFNGPAGTAPDASKWVHETGNNNGWGNGELENYTDSTNNSAMDGNGSLVITARKEQLNGSNYTSARSSFS